MAQINNRFYIQALEDGTTLHGSLISTGSLTQAWFASAEETGAARPDWSTAEGDVGNNDQPTIILTLLSGSSYVAPAMDSYQWLYNDAVIAFESEQTTYTTVASGPQIVGYKSVDGKFLKHTVSRNGQTMPALRIIGNIASSSNVDSDVITFKGTYVISGSGVAFAASTHIRITNVTDQGGNLGLIEFVDGEGNITQKGQTIQAYPRLFSASGSELTYDSDFTTSWHYGETTVNARFCLINEGNVTDHTILRCTFLDRQGQELYIAYAAIDDLTDPEYMYIQTSMGTYNASTGTYSYGDPGTGNAASLRKGESTQVIMWVGTTDNPEVDATWNVFKILMLNAEGKEIDSTHTFTGIPSPSAGDTNNWRTIAARTGAGNNKATFSITYDEVAREGKNMTFLILATKAVQVPSGS